MYQSSISVKHVTSKTLNINSQDHRLTII
jgi:hypothetical protein